MKFISHQGIFDAVVIKAYKGKAVLDNQMLIWSKIGPGYEKFIRDRWVPFIIPMHKLLCQSIIIVKIQKVLFKK